MTKTIDYRVLVAFGYHKVGDIIQPTGLWRDRLLRIKFIEPVETQKPALTSTPPRVVRRSHA